MSVLHSESFWAWVHLCIVSNGLNLPQSIGISQIDLQFQVSYVWKNSLSWKEFLVGFSVLSLSIVQAEKTSPSKAEWYVCLRRAQGHDLRHPPGYRGLFFCNENPDLIGLFLPPQCITFCPPRNSPQKTGGEPSQVFTQKLPHKPSPSNKNIHKHPNLFAGRGGSWDD